MQRAMLIERMGGLGNPVVSEPEFTRREQNS